MLQSRSFGEAAYHESLVHPAMFAHKNPRRAAILGGGEGATLREVLKHKTVEKVTMIDIDKEFVELARDHLSEWNDCSRIVGSTDCCFDDQRAELLFVDAIRFFLDRPSDAEPFDIIVADVL